MPDEGIPQLGDSGDGGWSKGGVPLPGSALESGWKRPAHDGVIHVKQLHLDLKAANVVLRVSGTVVLLKVRQPEARRKGEAEHIPSEGSQCLAWRSKGSLLTSQILHGSVGGLVNFIIIVLQQDGVVLGLAALGTGLPRLVRDVLHLGRRWPRSGANRHKLASLLPRRDSVLRGSGSPLLDGGQGRSLLGQAGLEILPKTIHHGAHHLRNPLLSDGSNHGLDRSARRLSHLIKVGGGHRVYSSR
ncbi:hypothetical protein Dimus_037894 [Dionaea muscipula]